MTRNSRYYSLLLLFVDIFVLTAAFTLAYIMRVQWDHRPLFTEIYAFDYLIAFLTVLPLWILIFASIGLYSATIYNRRLVEWAKIIIGCFIGILLIIGWEYVSDKAFFPARLTTLYAFIGSTALMILGRELLRLSRGLAFLYGKGVSNVLLIGSSKTITDIAINLSDTQKSGYHIAAIACPKSVFPEGASALHFSNAHAALKQVKELGITTIIQTELYESEERNSEILSTAQTNHLNYSFIPGEAEFYTGKNTVDVFLGYPMITVSQTPLIGWGAILKRFFDAFVVIITAPLWLIILIIISLLQLVLNPGPIFYKSKRLTKHGRVFGLYKFRSMKHRSTAHLDPVEEFRLMGREDLVKEYQQNFKVEKDPRITRFGSFLRKSSLDELPQVINVLKGDISLVGPRPIPSRELKAKFSQKRAALLLEVRSGLTGLWQVSGRSNIDTETRIKLELYYVRNWSFWLDIKILLKTVVTVIGRIGAR